MGIEENINYREELRKRDQKIAELEKLVEDLTKQLQQFQKPKKNSSNSSIPSSQNRYHKPYPQRDKSNLKPGGQPGHEGSTKKLVDNPEQIIKLKPQKCLHCGNQSFTETENIEKRQLFDIPPMKAFVVEYQKVQCQCSNCQNISSNDFPENIKASVQFSENIDALVGYLKIQNNLSHEKITKTLSDICGIALSEGTVDNSLTRLENRHTVNYENILQEVKNSEVLCSDETGTRVKGKNKYTWFFGNENWSYFKSFYLRAYSSIEEIFGEEFPKNWVSDRYGAQLKVQANHQVCLAHVIRDLKYVIEVDKSEWAKSLMESLKGVIHEIKEKGFDGIAKEKWEKKIKVFFERNEPPGGEASKKFRSLKKVVDSMVLFLKNPQVPWTNNLAERGLRSSVVHTKITGGFRSDSGVDRYNILNSVIESAKKQGLDILSVLSGKSHFTFTVA